MHHSLRAPYPTHISHRRIDLAHASESELEHLTAACQSATFGRNDQDVLDETYRKAGKLDREDYLVGFDAVHAGLIETIRTSLFPGQEEGRTIEAQLYKLNVYGALPSGSGRVRAHIETRHS